MDFAPYTEYAIYALVALAALMVLMLMIRMIGSTVRGKQGNRLGISEFHEIDKSRRLVLIRRDDVEHLVMIGGPQDVVIEQSIGLEEIAAPRYETPPRPEFISDREHSESASVTPIVHRSPKPAVFGDRAPNLRPVEREEPKLESAKSDKDRNS